MKIKFIFVKLLYLEDGSLNENYIKECIEKSIEVFNFMKFSCNLLIVYDDVFVDCKNFKIDVKKLYWIDGKDIEKINAEIIELNKRKAIKERFLEVFPGFHGQFLMF